ncbi:eEF1A lysine and N-terminal methyltransferase [Benincasa hispida]|uniref:eEF1A lysine and N-terminal methyltransferase n=1 Tax=Benincasa hispida TaxID=102211 RepID=UPI001901C387|nr:eEF1A lysine and N-terminal methyltransferase [Benincasa hispida]
MGKADDILQTLGNFTSKENWDNFFTIRGHGDAFEWYAEWPELKDPLISHLPILSKSPSPQILVPGCGNSSLSEQLYDAGFRCITNIDFSKVAISDMLRRNVRERPDMRWRVMDMTNMQFTDDTFDAVVDKGGLDALMEPEVGSKLGSQYLSEVKRVLKPGGKFICLTLAESHVLGLLFPKFRFGWKMSIHVIPPKPLSKPNFRTFMVVVEKGESTTWHQIESDLKFSLLDSRGNQTCELVQTLENENRIRQKYSSGADLLFSLEDLQLGAKGDLQKLHQGRRVQVTLGGQGTSIFSYRAVLLDAREHSGPFLYECGVFIVPKTRAHEWLFSSEEGQWMVVESSKAARLIMVLLDETQSGADMDAIQKDLSPLVKQLAPGEDDSGSQIPFMMASDGIKERNCVFQGTSSLTGSIVVEDVIYEHVSGDASRIFPSGDLKFRRLIFQRTESLVQSEALLRRERVDDKVSCQIDRKKSHASSKSKNKGKKRMNKVTESSDQMKVYHGYLASSYHLGIISGFMLISRYLEIVASAGTMVNAVVIGLGAGLLPMFLRACMSFLHIEVVELDSMILNLARDYFDFSENADLKVHIADGIRFVRELRNYGTNDSSTVLDNGNSSQVEQQANKKIDILIIDVDATDSSSGMTCPAADFVEEPFLLAVKDALSEQGLFIVNLVTRSPTVNDMVVARMKGVFNHLFSLQLEEDVNEVLFALPSDFCIKEDLFNEAGLQLEKLLNLKHLETRQSIVDATKKIRCLK